MQYIDLDAARIRLRGPDCEPTDANWRYASTARRAAYFGELARVAFELLYDRITRGIGLDGRKLTRVKPKSRPDGAKGPPLTPREQASRSRRLLAFSAGQDAATLYWRGGWGAILGYHARGAGHLPIRNIVGLMASELAAAVRRAREWWKSGGWRFGPPPPPLPRAALPFGVGADAPLPAAVLQALPPDLRGATRLSDLARSTAALTWWRRAGYRLWVKASRGGGPTPPPPRPILPRPRPGASPTISPP
jgi:hypothetical protein